MTETIVVCTDDSEGVDAALATAADRARDAGARLVLYDVSAPGAFTSPRPNEWAGEGAEEQFAHPLDPVELERLGRHGLALKVKHVRERGVDAYGWLPEDEGGGTLLDYARALGARVVLVPEHLPEQAPAVLGDIPPGGPAVEVIPAG